GQVQADPAATIARGERRAGSCRRDVEGGERTGDAVQIVEVVDPDRQLEELSARDGLEAELLAADRGREAPWTLLGQSEVAVEGRGRRHIRDAQRDGEETVQGHHDTSSVMGT